MNEKRVLVFGELLLRLSTDRPDFIADKKDVSIFPGGSEANVAASLAQWNVPVSYLSAVPDNALAHSALKVLQGFGTNTEKTLLQGERLGLYFLLSANGLSNGEVVYDRKFSAFSGLREGMIDWKQVLSGHTWFHWSALSPALNGHLPAVCLEAIKAARELGMTISVDLNYRNRLWDYGKHPSEVMPELVSYCDVIMGNIWAANTMLETPVGTGLNRNTSKEAYFEEACNSASALFKQFPGCKHLANTFRFMDHPRHNLFYGTYHCPGEHYLSDTYESFEIIDRIGSGDAFMAGLIYGLLLSMDGQLLIEQATKAGYHKLFVKGDFGDGKLEA